MYRNFFFITLILCCVQFAGAQQPKSELTLSVGGVFPSSSSTATLQRHVSSSVSGFLSYRYWLRPWTGFEFNYGHTRDTQTVTSSSSTTSIRSGMHEVTGAWLFGLPAAGALRPFVEIGGGLLQYSPSSSGSSVAGASSQNKPVFLYGAGVDYALTRHAALRFEYRGLVGAAPSFGLENQRTNTWSHIAEPAIGITYRF